MKRAHATSTTTPNDASRPAPTPTPTARPSALQRCVLTAAQCVFERLGKGWSEHTYREALCAELRSAHYRRHGGVHAVQREVVMPVRYEHAQRNVSAHVGFVRADVVIVGRKLDPTKGDESRERVVVELKALRGSYSAYDVQQLLNYLRVDDRGDGKTTGVLVNFDQSHALDTAVGAEARAVAPNVPKGASSRAAGGTGARILLWNDDDALRASGSRATRPRPRCTPQVLYVIRGS